MQVDPAVQKVRPIVVAGVLKNLQFTPASYKSFIDFQDKLHFNVGRQRSLVSIGTHDLDTIEGPFLYTAKPPQEIEFVALNQTQRMNAVQLFQHIDEHEDHLRPYLPLIRDSPVYPVIYDKNGVVLSLPPIINGDHSKITLQTRNVLVEITALDRTKALLTLATVLTTFSHYCDSQWEAHAVQIVSQDAAGQALGAEVTPDYSTRDVAVEVDYINGSLGLSLQPAEIITLLHKMTLSARPGDSANTIIVTPPPSRGDILHPCDVMEDVGIAYGFNKLPAQPPATVTTGSRQPRNILADLLRWDAAAAGFMEILTFSLCAIKENFQLLRRPDNGSAVLLENYKSEMTAACRTTLLVGALRTVEANLAQPLPIRIFEISDVVLKDPKNPIGASNYLRFCAVYADVEAGFEIIHGLVDRVFVLLGIKWDRQQGYFLLESTDPVFIEGRRADIMVNLPGHSAPVKLGSMGIVHPEVLTNFNLKFPCSAVEFSLEELISVVPI
jgi:phenylalanyl-tRNA synthetase beta chain